MAVTPHPRRHHQTSTVFLFGEICEHLNEYPVDIDESTEESIFLTSQYLLPCFCKRSSCYSWKNGDWWWRFNEDEQVEKRACSGAVYKLGMACKKSWKKRCVTAQTNWLGFLTSLWSVLRMEYFVELSHILMGSIWESDLSCMRPWCVSPLKTSKLCSNVDHGLLHRRKIICCTLIQD